MSAALHRRDFLRSSAAVITAAAGRHALGGPAPSASGRRVIVGAHPWVYAATLPDHDIIPVLDGIFADMKYAGMEGIELMHTALRPADATKRIGELSRKHDLPVIGTSFSGNMWDRQAHADVAEDARLVIRRLAALGGKTLGTTVGSPRRRKTEAELDAQAELLLTIIAIAADHGVELNLHNHKYEVEDDLHDVRGTLARIPEVKLGPDLDWLVQADVDPVWFINEFGQRIVFLHLRDQKADKTWVEAMGEGDMDYQAIGAALRKINFSGHAVIELAHPRGFKLTRPLRESLRLSRQYVKRTLGY